MKKVLSFVFAAMFAASVANAAVITQYTTAGSTTSLAASIVDPGVTADDLVAGSGLNVQTFSTFNFTGWNTTSTSFAAAVAENDFWTWGFDVTSSDPLDLTTMDIRLDRSGSGPDDFEIQASVNGGTPVTVLTHDYEDSSSGVTFTGVDLSGIATLNQGDSVVFTLAAFNSESNAGSFDLETVTFPGGSDSLVINGEFATVAIPEPSSVALMMLGAVAVSAVSMRGRLG